MRSDQHIRRQLLVDELDLEIMSKPIYKALKSDFLHESKQKRVIMSKLGEKFVEKNLPKTAIVEKTVAKKETETYEIVVSLQSQISSLLKPYEMDLSGLSGREEKRMRKKYVCYETKITEGFKTGHRKKFEDLAKVLGTFSESTRPYNEDLFNQVFGTLQKVVTDCI